MGKFSKLLHCEYVQLSARTVSPDFWITRDTSIQQASEGRIEGLHMAIGVTTEVQEILLAVTKSPVDVVNVGEEIADTHWYLAGLERIWGINLSTPQSQLIRPTPLIMACDLSKDAGEILDIYKKHLFYNKPVDLVRLQGLMRNISNMLETLTQHYDLDASTLKANNINKLLARFPDKFTSDLAINRNLDKERTELNR
jgi:hypothetical protein